MKSVRLSRVAVVAALGLFSVVAVAAEGHAEHGAAACEGFGPQTPRDIDSKKGENKRSFSLAPSYNQLNLCNIHFH